MINVKTVKKGNKTKNKKSKIEELTMRPKSNGFRKDNSINKLEKQILDYLVTVEALDFNEIKTKFEHEKGINDSMISNALKNLMVQGEIFEPITNVFTLLKKQ